MNKLADFGTVQHVSITILVDNRADLIANSTETVKRYTDNPLMAEHGFAALIDLHQGSAKTRILWDAGITAITLMENMRRMDIDPATIDKIAISHGHNDHVGGVTEVLKAMDLAPKAQKWEKDIPIDTLREAAQGRSVPLVMHPAGLRERWGIQKDGSKYGPIPGPPHAVWEALGAEMVLTEGPYNLGPGCWTTGFVPRLSFETSGISKNRVYRVAGQASENNPFIPDYLEDDQAIAICVQDKGLVIVSGCAHAGILNTIRHAQTISGVDKVWAILGGFHLARASDEDIARTIDEVQAMKPTLITPSHCTGFKAISQFAHRMPEEFVLGLVGTTYLF
jgi:7,8-dihydropterin-6-yl-methyl-4-(beta-D-ribofuranosyl)aminobenzene 5'-phosphate synthase